MYVYTTLRKPGQPGSLARGHDLRARRGGGCGSAGACHCGCAGKKRTRGLLRRLLGDDVITLQPPTDAGSLIDLGPPASDASTISQLINLPPDTGVAYGGASTVVNPPGVAPGTYNVVKQSNGLLAYSPTGLTSLTNWLTGKQAIAGTQVPNLALLGVPAAAILLVAMSGGRRRR